MGVLDKKLFLADLETKLADFVPAAMAQKVVEAAADALAGYDVTCTGTAAQAESTGDSLVKLFLDAKAIEGRSAKTIEHYRYVLDKLRAGIPVPLERITVHHLRQYMMSERDRGVSLHTLEGNRYVYSSFFGWLWKEELIPKNPAQNLAPIKQQKVIRKPLSDVEITKLLAIADIREKAIISFLLSTGCRISEVCGLDVLGVNLRTQTAKVLGKGAKERYVYIDDVACMYLNEYLNSRSDDLPALFVGKREERLTPGGIRTALNKVAERAGVENVHPHRFRRTRATSLIDHGMPIQEVAHVLGHEKIDTTMGYVYIDDRKVENAYRRYA